MQFPISAFDSNLRFKDQVQFSIHVPIPAFESNLRFQKELQGVIAISDLRNRRAYRSSQQQRLIAISDLRNRNSAAGENFQRHNVFVHSKPSFSYCFEYKIRLKSEIWWLISEKKLKSEKILIFLKSEIFFLNLRFLQTPPPHPPGGVCRDEGVPRFQLFSQI